MPGDSTETSDSNRLGSSDRLREYLFSLTLEFGPSFPVKPQKVGETAIMCSSDFAGCYPGLKELCHYTDACGLEGILKSGVLWATNSAYLNDPDEFQFAYRVFEDMVSGGEHALDKTLLGAFRDGLWTTSHYKRAKTYFISFSGRRDDLSQFRAYSADARGYALEFEPCALIQSLNSYLSGNSGEHITLRKVRYGTEDLCQFHTRAIDKLKECIRELPYPVGSQEMLKSVRGLGMAFSHYLRDAGVVFKQEGYRSEEEYRAVLDVAGSSALPYDQLKDLSVRFRNALPVPYIPFRFLEFRDEFTTSVDRDSQAGLFRITIGPGLDFDLAKTGLHYLLSKNGLGDVRLEASTCSYRSWQV